MIGYLKGSVVGTRKNALILDVHDVGYLVHVTSQLLNQASIGKELALLIHTHETSDTVSLFGFAKAEDLSAFELLNSVNGVGPKTALAILETPVSKLKELIAAGNAKELGKIPGIGPKTAARIVLELKNKLFGEITVPETASQKIDEEVFEALEALGYKNSYAKKVLAELPDHLTRTEEIVTWFLRVAR